MVPLDAIVDLLRGDPVIAGKVGVRLYDHDPRRSQHPEMFSAYGNVLPTLAVDDRGGTRPPFAQDDAFQDFVYVWAFAMADDDGRATIRTLMGRAITLLNGWQDPVSRATVRYADRFGDQASSLEGGAMDYARFSVVGTHLGAVI